MELSNLTILLTDDCTSSCSYCYQQKGKKYLEFSTIIKALDFFFPFFTQECSITFYGGEPLLAFENIQKSADYIKTKNKNFKKQIRFSITTNGDLIDDKVIDFFNENKFSVVLSFDGFAQDISRRKGSFSHIESLLNSISSFSDFSLETNSVFTAETVGYLSRSMKYIVESGVSDAAIAASKSPPWDSEALLLLKKELSFFREYLLSYYKNTGQIPVSNFRKVQEEGIFACFGGKDRMALAPDGNLWGCYMFLDYFKKKKNSRESRKYSFGSLDSFIKKHGRIYPKILDNYAGLQMDHYYTSNDACALCKDLGECLVCPVDAAFISSRFGKIPDWVCEIKKIFINEKALFLKEIESICLDN